MAGMGAGMGAGMVMGQAMAGAMQNGMAQPQPVSPTAAQNHQDKLTQLKALLDNGLISQADYDTAKAEVLKQLLG